MQTYCGALQSPWGHYQQRSQAVSSSQVADGAQSKTDCQVTLLFSSGEVFRVFCERALVVGLAWLVSVPRCCASGGRSLLGSGPGLCCLLSWCWCAVSSSEDVSHRCLVPSGLRSGARCPPIEGRGVASPVWRLLSVSVWCLPAGPDVFSAIPLPLPAHTRLCCCRSPLVLANLAGARKICLSVHCLHETVCWILLCPIFSPSCRCLLTWVI